MSIYADPLFVAAEVQYRTRHLSDGLAASVPARHHGLAVRTALGRVIHAHRHSRGAPRTGPARMA